MTVSCTVNSYIQCTQPSVVESKLIIVNIVTICLCQLFFLIGLSACLQYNESMLEVKLNTTCFILMYKIIYIKQWAKSVRDKSQLLTPDVISFVTHNGQMLMIMIYFMWNILWESFSSCVADTFATFLKFAGSQSCFSDQQVLCLIIICAEHNLFSFPSEAFLMF